MLNTATGTTPESFDLSSIIVMSKFKRTVFDYWLYSSLFPIFCFV